MGMSDDDDDYHKLDKAIRDWHVLKRDVLSTLYDSVVSSINGLTVQKIWINEFKIFFFSGIAQHSATKLLPDQVTTAPTYSWNPIGLF